MKIIKINLWNQGRTTPKERKILEGITKKNCLEGCQYAKFTSEHNKITEANDEYLEGHKNNKPRGTRVSLELDNNPGRIYSLITRTYRCKK